MCVNRGQQGMMKGLGKPASCDSASIPFQIMILLMGFTKVDEGHCSLGLQKINRK